MLRVHPTQGLGQDEDGFAKRIGFWSLLGLGTIAYWFFTSPEPPPAPPRPRRPTPEEKMQRILGRAGS